MRKTIWLVALVAILAFAACTSSAEDQDAAADTTTTQAPGDTGDQSDRIDRVTIALSAFGNESLDPQLGTGQNEPFQYLIYDPIIGVDQDFGEPSKETGIAEDWELSEDGLTLTLFIREGVEFHDGHEVTAEDVQFSLQRAFEDFAATSYVGFTRGIIGSPENVRVIDDYTVEVGLEQNGASLVSLLPFGATDFLVLPKHYIEEVGVEEFRQNPIGSGPYRFVDQVSGSSITLEAVDSHFALGQPWAETVEFILAPEVTTRSALLRTGEADVVDASIEEAAILEDEGFLRGQKGIADILVIYEPTIAEQQEVPNDPLLDQRVREALMLAIDIDAINENLYDGVGNQIGNYFVPASLGFQELPGVQQDVERARELLEEAGVADGFEVNLETFPKPGWDIVSTAEAIVADWADIGVTAAITYGDYAIYRDKWAGGGFTVPTVTLHPSSSRIEHQGLLMDTFIEALPYYTPEMVEELETDFRPRFNDATSVEERNEVLHDLDRWICCEKFIAQQVFQIQPPIMSNESVGTWETGNSGESLNLRGLFWQR